MKSKTIGIAILSALLLATVASGKPKEIGAGVTTNAIPASWGHPVGFTNDSQGGIRAQYSILMQADDGTLRTVAVMGDAAYLVQTIPRQ